MKKAFCLFMIFVISLLCGCSSKAPVQSGIFVMDTYFSVTDYSGRGGFEAVFGLMNGLEKKLSVTDPDSEISRVNSANGGKVTLSADTAELLRETLLVSEKTNGAIDPSLYPVTAEWGFTTGEYKIPSDERISALLELCGYEKISLNDREITVPAGMKLDLGASAKGFALDKAAELLKENGAESVVLNLGGNIRTVGKKPDGSLWRTAIADPFSPSENLCVIEMGEGTAATSGGYERYFTGDDGNRYCHLIDPKSGRPVNNGLASVTVIGGDALLCDALSTALFVMGREEAERFWRENGGFQMVIVEEDGRIFYTEGLKDGFRLASGRENTAAEVIRG